MFNSRIINGLKEELKIKSQIIELQEQIVSLLLKQNEMLLSKLLENENTTTENSDVQVNTIFDGKVIGDSIATVLKKKSQSLVASIFIDENKTLKALVDDEYDVDLN